MIDAKVLDLEINLLDQITKFDREGQILFSSVVNTIYNIDDVILNCKTL